MSVIGIDFGNDGCFIAAAKSGGIETLANDYSLRSTPSCIAFAGKKRILGVAAKNQQVTNMKNTITGFKRLLGRKFNDPHVQSEAKKLPFRLEQKADGGIGIRVNYMDEEHVFSPEQITAMLFTKLKETTVNALQAQVNDCVLTCPSYFTNAERKALLDSAAIAGLNVLRLVNETTATALSYGFYKQDLPEPEAKSRNVIFVDCGHASLQISACAFNKGKLKMIACASEQVGGRDFDLIMAEWFSKDFITKYKVDPRTNPRAFLRLLTECEKLKKQMSANSTKLPLNIECFMNEIDVTSSMQRVDMEEMCAGVFKKIELTMKKLLKESKLSQDDIHSVEIVGGSSRIPTIKNMIEQIFGKTASTTLNQDEAVSRGGALQCAIMSPAVRVRDFSTTDIQMYPIKASWDGEGGQTGEMEVYPAMHAAPYSRVLTLFRREPFNMEMSYSDSGEVPFPDSHIGRWHIKDVKPNANGESQEVKIKVRINNHGIVLISSASMVEKLDKDAELDNSNEEVQEPMDTVPEVWLDDANECEQKLDNEQDYKYPGQHHKSPEKCTSPTTGPGWAQRVKGWFSSENNTEGGKKDKKKKPTTKSTELPLEAKTHGYAQTELNNYFEEECKMITYDHHEMERIDARNNLEEYVYDMRDKLGEDGQLAAFVIVKDRESLIEELNGMENWLYEEGEDCEKQAYRGKLTSLQEKIDPIKARSIEYEQQPGALNELSAALQLARKAVNEFRAGDVKYDHLTETEILNISETADKINKWLDDARSKCVAAPKTSDPTVKVADIRSEYQTLTTCVNSVLNRPKPNIPPPTPTPTPAETAEPGAEPPKPEEKHMDVD